MDLAAWLRSPAALDALRRFEQRRHELSLLIDVQKPDKRSTKFVSVDDLVWAWLSSPDEYGLQAVASAALGCSEQLIHEELGRMVASWELSQPPMVEQVILDGGLRFG